MPHRIRRAKLDRDAVVFFEGNDEVKRLTFSEVAIASRLLREHIDKLTPEEFDENDIKKLRHASARAQLDAKVGKSIDAGARKTEHKFKL